MRFFKPLLALAALCLGFAWSVPAMAYGHFHGGARVGIFVGPGFGPWYYPYYYGPYVPYGPYGYAPYYAPAMLAPAAPTTYIEQGSGQAASQASANYWYYCADSQGYYPYVQQCRGGWQRVSPTPPQ